PVVVDGTEVDDLVAAERETPRPSAGREQQLLERVALSSLVAHLVLLEVERDHPAAERQLDTQILCAAPDRALVLALPERLRQRGAQVGRVWLLAYDTNRAIGVVFAYAPAG